MNKKERNKTPPQTCHAERTLRFSKRGSASNYRHSEQSEESLTQ